MTVILGICRLDFRIDRFQGCGVHARIQKNVSAFRATDCRLQGLGSMLTQSNDYIFVGVQ